VTLGGQGCKPLVNAPNMNPKSRNDGINSLPAPMMAMEHRTNPISMHGQQCHGSAVLDILGNRHQGFAPLATKYHRSAIPNQVARNVSNLEDIDRVSTETWDWIAVANRTSRLPMMVHSLTPEAIMPPCLQRRSRDIGWPRVQTLGKRPQHESEIAERWH